MADGSLLDAPPPGTGFAEVLESLGVGMCAQPTSFFSAAGGEVEDCWEVLLSTVFFMMPSAWFAATHSNPSGVFSPSLSTINCMLLIDSCL